MNIALDAIFALGGFLILVATFTIGRMTAAKHDGAKIGVIDTTLSHMANDLKDIKATLKIHKDDYSALNAELIRLSTRLDAAFVRIDELKEKL